MTSRVIVSLSGQPATVRSTVTRTVAVVVDLDGVDHAEVGDRALDLGVVDRARAALTCSRVGLLMMSQPSW